MIRRFLRKENGAIAIIVALLTPFLLAGMAFAVETGLWFMTQRQLQHSADTAAYSAAVALASGDSQAQAAAVAQRSALDSGLDPERGQITVSFPAENRAQVVLQTSRVFMFLRVVDLLRGDGERYFDEAQMIAARAVAEVLRADPGQSIPVCIMSLSPQGLGVDIGGTASFSMPECTIDIHSGSTPAMRVAGNAAISAACVTVRGTISGADQIITDPDFCEGPRQNATPRPPPEALQNIERPANPASVPNRPRQSGETTITASHTSHPSGVPMRRFQGGLDLPAGNYVFEPGLYIIDGGQFRTRNNTVIDAMQGVAFYFINGAYLSFHGGSSAAFRGLAGDAWQGIVFFDSGDAASAQYHNLVTTELEGVIYLPRATFEFSGGQNINDGCFALIAGSFRFTGNAAITANCDNAQVGFDWIYEGGGGDGEGPVENIRLIE
ncbi:MAG: pilus assembly protein [Pararhodobacter sp.]|nr:pilus assembly protein [Pararhodobacter sp.]